MKRDFLESLRFGIDGNLLCYYFLLKIFQQKRLKLKYDSAVSGGGQGK
jgi:hypothetical protein